MNNAMFNHILISSLDLAHPGLPGALGIAIAGLLLALAFSGWLGPIPASPPPRRWFYYLIKPHVPWRLRLALRRIVAQRQRRASRQGWPVNPSAARKPEGWPGWPEGKEFALVLTHDVEGPEGLAKTLELMALERELGFRSSFNFIPEGDYRVPPGIIKELKANGFEVGVHDLRHDGKLYWSWDQFLGHAKAINAHLAAWGAKGFRSGFMLHQLDWLHDLDVTYDASTFDTDPFEPQPDGMNTIFPFWVPGPQGRGYAELPYTIPQDSTLFLVLQESTPAIWKSKLDWVAEHGGMALINVHPDYVRFAPGRCGAGEFPAAHYREWLEYIKARHGGTYWHVLPETLAEWYAANRVKPDVKPAQ